MRKHVKWTFLLGVVVVATMLPAQTKPEQSATVGRWKLNVQKSDWGKMPPPKSVMVTVSEDTPTALKWHATGVESDGKKIDETFVGAVDGKEYPIKGSPNDVSVAYTRESDNTIMAMSKGKDGTTVHGTITLSDDKNTMTLKNTASGPKGESSWTEVFERVPAAKKAASAAPKK